MKIHQLCATVIFWFAVLPVSAQNGKIRDTSMVVIPAADFMMGKDAGPGADFSPAHRVTTSSFLLDKYEVSNRAYLEFCRETNYRLPEFWNNESFRSGDKFLDYPVVGITWWDAGKYAEWAGKRLPTEAEWECAARGGLTGMEYPNGNTWTQLKPLQDKSGWKNLIEPVSADEPNGYGLYNMGGNAWEWVNDSYAADYYKTGENNNPRGPKTGDIKVIRSGSWHSGAMCKKVYYRKGLPSSWCDFAVGFRCAKNITP